MPRAERHLTIARAVPGLGAAGAITVSPPER